MRSPFAWIVFCFSLGIIFASRVRIPFVPAWGIAVSCCVVFAFFMHKHGSGNAEFVSFPLFFCAVFFCGAACLMNNDAQPANHIRHLVFKAMGGRCAVKGCVASEPFAVGSRTVFHLKTGRFSFDKYSYDCSGLLLVAVNGSVALEYGQAVEAAGMLRLPSAFRGSRRTSIRDYLQQKGIYAILRVPSPGYIRRTCNRDQQDIVAVSLRLKKKFQQKIHAVMSPVAAGIMEAMLLGDKKDIPRSVYTEMIKTGTVHILVVSGFNVGIIAGICALFLKVLRLNRMIRLVIIVPALVFYCMMTGASPPVVRATIMGIFFFFSWYVRRDPGISQALSLSAFIILVFAPRELYDASFQLSFAAVSAICSLSPAMVKLFHADKISLRPVRWAAGLGITSLSAWLGTAGFIAYYFRTISPIAVLANIFIPVIASFITLCGVGLVVSGFLCPYFASSFASVSEALIVFLLWVNSLLIHVPGGYARLP